MRNLRDYATVTGTYWVFTLTDGALRMLVLLHLHEIGYAPLEIASLFLLYEFFGVVTNLLGGWFGARYGLKSTLFSGLALQVLSCTLLALRAATLTIPVILLAQALSGIAKDLTKMSSKSYIKLVVPTDDRRGLMKWVAVLTGSKNALKGLGFFLGGVMLATVGFQGACIGMADVLVVTLIVAVAILPKAPGKAASKPGLRHLFSRDARINWLSAARLFLFGSRDIWFVLALPIFLSASLGLSHAEVGGALAVWVIGYGCVQALAPAYAGGKGRAPDSRRLGAWTAALVVPLWGMLGAFALGAPDAAVLVVGLVVFGVVFATDSAVHSFLIIAYAEGDKVALNVGFYYMANAMGRLLGTILSGALFQAAGEGRTGLIVCLAGSLAFVLISAALCLPLRAAERSRA